jgi:phosphate transport system permease protein
MAADRSFSGMQRAGEKAGKTAMSSIGREWLIKKILMVMALMTVLGLALVVFFVTRESVPAFTQAGPANLFSSAWNPGDGRYGMLVFLTGTLATTAGGLLLGTPLALGLALFLTQVAPRRSRSLFTRGVEILAGFTTKVGGWVGFTIQGAGVR